MGSFKKHVTEKIAILTPPPPLPESACHVPVDTPSSLRNILARHPTLHETQSDLTPPPLAFFVTVCRKNGAYPHPHTVTYFLNDPYVLMNDLSPFNTVTGQSASDSRFYLLTSVFQFTEILLPQLTFSDLTIKV